MVTRNKLPAASVLLGSLLWTASAGAYEIQTNTAKMQAMDKITGRVSVIEVPVNGEVKFGSFSIVVRACKKTPPEETPENYAFVDVADTGKDGKPYNIFKGWMMSSSPALNAVEHPIYDVWLLQCIDKTTDKKSLLSDEALAERDGLPRQEDLDKAEKMSKEALIAAEAEAEKIRMQAQQLTIAVERLNGDIRSITEELSGSDSRIAVLENDIARNEESAAALREDIAAGEQDSTEAAAALERHRAVARSMAATGVASVAIHKCCQNSEVFTEICIASRTKSKCDKLAAELAELDAELLRLTSENNASGARRDILRAEVADLTAKRTEAQVAKAAAEAAAQAAQEQLPALAENTEALEAQRDEAKQDLADTIEYRKMLAENEKQLANVKAGVELKLKGRRTALNEADAAEQKLGRELDAARQRLGVLKELEKNMDVCGASSGRCRRF